MQTIKRVAIGIAAFALAQLFAVTIILGVMS